MTTYALYTQAETGHTVLVIPDAEWPSASSDSGDGELLKWIKDGLWLTATLW